MISIKNKQDCCGCTACVKRCPQQCIIMYEDEEGFLYPKVDVEKCIDCGLCEKVCPVINQGEKQEVLHIYAVIHPDDNIRKNSSSGGLFTYIAERVIDMDGVVFGAGFNENWDIWHNYTKTKEGIAAFRGSKYVQSHIGNCYQEVERFLNGNRQVLFSGTPCQVAGLKRFLHREYENLLTVDFFCHGVPSPKVWRMYLDETIARQCEKNSVLSSPMQRRNTLIKGISFRNKRLGWKKYSFTLSLSTTDGSGDKNTVLLSELLSENIYLRGFMSNLFLRPSCHACRSKEFRSSSDITIADCWGLQYVYPELDDDKGYSLCVLKNERLNDCISKLNLHPLDMNFVRTYNPSCFISPAIPSKRADFFRDICNKGVSVIKSIDKYSTYPNNRFKVRIVRLLQIAGVYPFAKKIIGKG